MNVEKHLILVKGEDRTEAISYCTYENGKWQVDFGNGKIYSYNYANVQWLKDPVSYDPSMTVVYHKNQPQYGVDKILDFGKYIRLCYSRGYNKVYPQSELKVEKNDLSNPQVHNCFDYLKQLAAKVNVSDEDESGFLSKQYVKMTFISPNSVLAKYLNPTVLRASLQDVMMPIFPFGFNLSQKAAVENALTQQISVIEGPPGTGKTQTILNIIADVVMRGKTVAVVSNNNTATANVLEKLQKYDVDFIAAYLGNKTNKEKFFSAQTSAYPDMASWAIAEADVAALNKALEESGHELKVMLEVKNKVALLKQERSALSVEKEYFYTYYQETNEPVKPYRSLYKHNSGKILSLWLDYQRMVEKNNRVTPIYMLKNLMRYGITSFSFYKDSNEKIISFLQKTYYEHKEKELNGQIEVLTKRLEHYRFENAIKDYSEKSMKLFKAKLAQKYPFIEKRPKFSNDALWKNFDAFIKEYPVILSTTHSLRTCISENYLFDYVIMDEASQVDIVSGALALSCAKNAVIVGDLRQLPNVVPNDVAEETTRIFTRASLHQAYNFAENSMLSSITMLFEDVPKTLLKEHYRCHPKGRR